MEVFNRAGVSSPPKFLADQTIKILWKRSKSLSKGPFINRKRFTSLALRNTLGPRDTVILPELAH